MSQATTKRIHEAAMALFARTASTTLTISDLADEAGVARGTIYNNVESLSDLFQQVCATSTAEMNQHIADMNADIEDPLERLVRGIKLFLKRAHEEPVWGRFVVTFGASSNLLREIWSGPPSHDLMAALATGQLKLNDEQIPHALAMLAGTTGTSILLILEGLSTWRTASSEAVRMIALALGVKEKEARRLAALPV